MQPAELFFVFNNGKEGTKYRDKSSLREKSDYMGSVHFIQPKCTEKKFILSPNWLFYK